jgi:hypothetical protein
MMNTLGWALSKEGVRPLEKLILIRVADSYGVSGEIALAALEKFTGRSPDKIVNALHRLRSNGIIEWDTETTAPGSVRIRLIGAPS